jgi:hypothetical protein
MFPVVPSPASPLLSLFSLCFNHEEFCNELCIHRKTCPFAVFPGSGGLFERWVALCTVRTASFGPPRRASAGFRRFRWRPQLRQKCQNPATDPQRRQLSGGVAPLPRQPLVGHATTCQTQLRVSGDHQPRPPIGLLGRKTKPSYPLIGPTGDDGLAGRVA